jgi:hypothetical protein
MTTKYLGGQDIIGAYTLETIELKSWWDAFERRLNEGHAWEEAADLAWKEVEPDGQK